MQTAEFGCGLDDMLRRQAWKLTGVCARRVVCCTGPGACRRAPVGCLWLEGPFVGCAFLAHPASDALPCPAFFLGVVNGIDTAEWSPACDPHLHGSGYAPYIAATLDDGKARCKAALQRVRGAVLVEWEGRMGWAEQPAADRMLRAACTAFDAACSALPHLPLPPSF